MGYTWQYYDLVLLGIAGSVVAGAAVGLGTPVDLTTSVPLLALVGVALMGHALFVNGPVDEVGDLAEDVDDLQ